MAEPEGFRVEVVLSVPGGALRGVVAVSAGTTAGEAARLAASREGWSLPGGDLPDMPDLGIHGRRVSPGQRLAPGDRLEIYRPLTRDPKDARRQRAAGGG